MGRFALVLMCAWRMLLIASLATSVSASESITYTYDVLGRVVATGSSGTVNDGHAVSITYDAAGNRTNYTVTGASLGLSIGNASATEGVALSFTVTRSGSTAGAVSVDYATSNGTASAGSDYTSASGTLSFAAGEVTKTISVNTIDDSVSEADETLNVTLSNAVGVAIAVAVGTGTITDNDAPAAQLAISDASATEGSPLIFTVTRSGLTTGSTSVNYATSNGTAAAGSDYTAVSGTLTFTAGQTSKTLTVNTTADTLGEAHETLTMTLSSPTGGATLLDATGTGTINNDDVTFAISDVTATEGSTLTFTVTKAGAHTGSRSVSYATSNAMAIASSDYTAASGTLSFSSSQTSRTFTVSTVSDTVAEATESFIVTLSGPTGGATLTNATALGFITDNDGIELATWDAVGLYHTVGFAEREAWAVNVLQPSGSMVHGPSTTTVPVGSRTARFWISIDDHAAVDGNILFIDVYDATSDQIIASRTLNRHAWTASERYQAFDVPFSFPTARAGHQMQFRVWFYNSAHIRVQRVGYY